MIVPHQLVTCLASDDALIIHSPRVLAHLLSIVYTTKSIGSTHGPGQNVAVSEPEFDSIACFCSLFSVYRTWSGEVRVF